jgi:hypothetical protein
LVGRHSFGNPVSMNRGPWLCDDSAVFGDE